MSPPLNFLGYLLSVKEQGTVLEACALSWKVNLN